MKTEKMIVTSHESGMQEALAMTERLGTDCGLEKKQILHLRLLAEELFGMLRSIAGNVEAEYWLEQEDKRFEMHMKSDVLLTDEMREQFISAASSGENDAARGFMGKLRVMIAEKLFANTPGSSLLTGFSLGMMTAASPVAQEAGASAYLWSMEKYVDELIRQKDSNAAASEEWDELEKSIMAKIADEVIVRIVGCNVEITVCKAF